MANTFIGLAGNPNCGKTTLFNELTGSNGYVGNWPGVTVEKKQAVWRADKDVTFVDLPGIYSLSPYTPEEVVSRDYVVNERPDALIDLVDVTNLERNLYLTTQLLEAGRPVVVGLNMCDLLKERGDVVDAAALSERLGCPVQEVSALHNTNVDALVKQAVEAGKKGIPTTGAKCFSPEVEAALSKIAEAISGQCDEQLSRWYSIKVFERDAEAIAPLHLSAEQLAAIEPVIKAVEEARDDDSESIITSDRYDWITQTMEACVKKAPKKLTTSEKIDKIVTNRILGLPIFVVVMVLVYYISISTVGTAATDWVNENLFGDGFFTNGASQEQYEADAEDWAANSYGDQIDGFLAAADEAGLDTGDVSDAVAALSEDADDAEAMATVEAFADEAKEANVVATDVPVHDEDGNFLLAAESEDEDPEVVTTLDADGEPVLEAGQQLEVIDSVDASDFVAAVEGSLEEPDPADYDGFVPSIPDAVTGWLEDAGASDVVTSLVVDGIIGGVGSVLGFIPQMFVLFVLLCFLEDCGYMSRVAFVMDRVFRRFGLSGKSFIPMLIGTGCGIPGVMASRTIENERDRRMTIMTTTFIPCGAKVPFIAMVAGAIFGGAAWVATSAYFVGMAAIIISGIMLKKTKMFSGDPAPFVMELPAYHWPTVGNVLRSMWERGWSFIKKAGTIILLSTIVVWFTTYFGWVDGTFQMLSEEQIDASILAKIGNAIAWIFAPLGWGTWQAAVASITGLVAKENIVGTMGILYPDGWAEIGAAFTQISGYSFLVFNLLCAPCFAAIGAIKREMNNAKWTWFAIGYQCGFAYLIALMINQFGNAFTGSLNVIGLIAAIVVLAGMIYMLFKPYKEATKLSDKH